MKLVVDLDDPDSLGLEVMRVMEARGMVMVRPERVEPYSMREVSEMAGISVSLVHRLANQGVLKRVPYVGRVLLTARSVEDWMRGKEAV